MGDFFERIVDVEVGADDAGALAGQMIDWMVSQGRLSRETSPEGMYSRHADEGYVAGVEWRQITQEWGEDWKPGPVAVVVGRHAHYPGQGEVAPAAAHCPHCRAATVIIDYPQRWEPYRAVWQPFSDAIDRWQASGAGAATCVSCGAASPVATWRWADDFALGSLAFDFWGWPPLTEEFVAEFGARLGHRFVHHTGKF
ncbi:hypothetical protein [Nocardia higoensis]|uniref:hypothetical protein n=1 Tax=Nocardia higoensis TaxID=228599 RepID=UPI0002FFE3FB|nr:hypothetical protein [Nocardia higoensis]